jgi:hypothetical protein
VNQAPDKAIESQNSPQLPRVVTPAPRSVAPPRMTATARDLYPINLSQGDFLDMIGANHAISYVYTNLPMTDTVLNPTTGKEMQYRDIMKDSTLGPLYKNDWTMNLGA